MLFLYEGTGLSGFQKDGVNYYYLRNGQDDIIGILDSSGTRVVSYTYDAWGKVLTTTGSMASTLGAQNPFRYRGYYFDTESGLYYLQSRYYDPNTGRFLNADGQLNPGTGNIGMNLFAYCNNNQVNAVDPDGHRMLAYNGTSSVVVSAAGLAAALAAAAAASSQAPVYLPYGGTVNKPKTTNKAGGISVVQKSATYVPPDQTKDMYIAKAKPLISPSATDYGALLVGGIASLKLIASKFPGLGYVIIASDLWRLYEGQMDKFDLENYEKVMNQGKGVVIVSWDVEGDPRAAGGGASYYPWDGSRDYGMYPYATP